jgi:hypothetical protein
MKHSSDAPCKRKEHQLKCIFMTKNLPVSVETLKVNELQYSIVIAHFIVNSSVL